MKNIEITIQIDDINLFFILFAGSDIQAILGQLLGVTIAIGRGTVHGTVEGTKGLESGLGEGFNEGSLLNALSCGIIELYNEGYGNFEEDFLEGLGKALNDGNYHI